jgi:hypothetical protein
MRPIFAILLLLNACHCQPDPDPAAAFQKSYRWLWAQQSEDGAWRSRTHGLLKGGSVLTPYILYVLLNVPDSLARNKPTEREQRGLAYLRAHIAPDGALRGDEPLIEEYPNYATAYALVALAKFGDSADSVLVKRMQSYLIGQQFCEHRGIMPENWAYGAWGFGEKLPHGQYGHTDLSHTRRILQALRASGLADASVYEKAQHFLLLAQKHPSDPRLQPPDKKKVDISSYDGGFYYSPLIFAANKGGMTADSLFASYATATCDGILALLAAGLVPSDERVQSAWAWMKGHPAWSFPEGIPEDHSLQWQRVMKFYHLSAKAETLHALNGRSPESSSSARKILESLQAPDGHFENPDGAANKEDDPLIATAMAITCWRYVF